MSYQVLARKWRPKSFSEMAGQEHVLQALINALDNDRLHHAYLFTGTRGVGKTTIGRILSKCLNCETGVSSVPCGECSSCTEIDAGRFIDLIEVDAASRTGVDDMRDLLDNVQYAPSRGRFKIYLIDEIHMLSKSSFAALLKTLEEPPPHVKFLFATTDPQKLPITVLSRCLQFNLKNLSAERITEHLKYVLGEEKVPFEEAGLWSLGRAADGSMRDALSLTDQAVGHGGGSITESDVISMLGTIERHFVVDICIAMASQNGEKLLSSVGQMAEHSPDYDAALGDVLSIWHQVAILQTVPEALDRGISHFDELANLAETVSREDVQLFYQICLLGRKDLPLAPEQRAGFEMVMLRAMAFRPAENGRPVPLKSPPPEVEQPAKKPEPAPTADVSHHSAGIAYKDPNESLDTEATVEENKLKETLEALDIDLLNEEPAVEITNDDKVELLADNVTELDKSISADSQVCEGVNKVSLNEFLPSHWIEVASHCLFTARVDDVLQFIIDDQENSLFDASHQESLGVALSDYFDQPLTVSINSGVAKDETPRAANIRENNERKAAAVERLNTDPSVIQFKQLFNGGLDEQSVESID